MIFGVGLDLVEIARIAALLERNRDAFLDRILHPDERSERLDRAEGPTHLAGLFAAKEAVMKALGTGMAGAAFSEIQIHHGPSGQPQVRLHGATHERAEAAGVGAWHVSITHDKASAAAVAIALSA